MPEPEEHLGEGSRAPARTQPRLRGRVSRPRSGPLARRIFFVQLGLIAIVCVALSTMSYVSTLDSTREATSARVLSIAETLAHDPFVAEAVAGPNPSARLQPFALTVMKTANVDFITIMNRDRTRYTHPNPAQLGKPYIGSTTSALAGKSQVEQYSGTLGPSVRAIAPITDADGRVIAMVAVGVTLQTLSVARAAWVPEIILVGLAAIALGGLGSWMISRYLRRVTLGYGPEQLRSLFTFYDSALHSLREGLVLVDDGGALVLYNDEAAALLGLPEPEGGDPIPLAEVALPPTVRALLESGRDAVDEIHFTRDRVLVVNQKRASQPSSGNRAGGGDAGAEGHLGEDSARSASTRPHLGRKPATDTWGTVVTLRDRTDIQELTGELETMRTLAEALRAQTHEHANRLHTVSTLIELGRDREALDFAVRDQQESQRLTDAFVGALDEPFITALLIGKASQANERGIELTITASGDLPPGRLDSRDLVTVAGNLLDNAFDAAAGSAERHVWADFVAADGELIITIADSGPGIDAAAIDRIFRLGVTDKVAEADAPSTGGHGFGLVLVRQAVTRLGGELDVASDGGAIFTVTLPLGDNDGVSEIENDE